jgi:hypothetical protein
VEHPRSGKSRSTFYRETFRRHRKPFSVQMTLGAIARSKSWSRLSFRHDEGRADDVPLEQSVLFRDSEELAMLRSISRKNARRLPARIETHK